MFIIALIICTTPATILIINCAPVADITAFQPLGVTAAINKLVDAELRGHSGLAENPEVKQVVERIITRYEIQQQRDADRYAELGVQVGIYKNQKDTAINELNKIKSPVAGRSRIEEFERQNEMWRWELSKADQEILKKIKDVKTKKIKQIALKWMYMLSEKNPRYKLDINQKLLERLRKANVSVEDFCNAVGVVFEFTSSQMHEICDIKIDDIKIRSGNENANALIQYLWSKD